MQSHSGHPRNFKLISNFSYMRPLFPDYLSISYDYARIKALANSLFMRQFLIKERNHLIRHFWCSNFKHKMQRLQILQKLVYEKVYVHKTTKQPPYIATEEQVIFQRRAFLQIKLLWRQFFSGGCILLAKPVVTCKSKQKTTNQIILLH